MRIRTAQEERDQAQVQGQQRSSEAAEARRRVAELEGALSVSSNAQVCAFFCAIMQSRLAIHILLCNSPRPGRWADWLNGRTYCQHFEVVQHG